MIRMYILGTLLVLVLAFVAWKFVEPAPPRNLIIATGDRAGGYYGFAERYAERFAAEGIALEPRETSGSVENLELLVDPESGVDLAFVQGGTRLPDSDVELQTIGCMYFEPLWLFSRRDADLERLTDLKGKRVAVGAERSGVRPLVLKLLGANEIGEDAAELIDAGGAKAAEALIAGELDAAFFIMSAEAPIITELFGSDDLALFDFKREDAYLSRFRFLSSLQLTEGMVDLARNIPPQTVHLLAPTANLVARADLHPAFIDLALKAATEVHQRGGWFEAPGQFPSPDFADYPVSPDADRFFQHGPSFLQRYLPFWLATQIDRLKIMLLPFVMLLLPLGKLLPSLLQWRVRSKFYRIYSGLLEVEHALPSEMNAAERESALARVRELEDRAARIRAPKSYSGELFNVRLHAKLVRERVMERVGRQEAAAPPAKEVEPKGVAE